jgi:hypothetical protein
MKMFSDAMVRVNVRRKDLLKVLDSLGDTVEIEFVPNGSLLNMDKIRVGDAMVKCDPDLIAHCIIRFPNFKDKIKGLKVNKITLEYGRHGYLELFDGKGKYIASAKEMEKI